MNNIERFIFQKGIENKYNTTFTIEPPIDLIIINKRKLREQKKNIEKEVIKTVSQEVKNIFKNLKL